MTEPDAKPAAGANPGADVKPTAAGNPTAGGSPTAGAKPSSVPVADKASAGNAKPPGDKAPEEWKPEPRQWTWKDLFTAPMLAFKPKCMFVSAITVILVALWMGLRANIQIPGTTFANQLLVNAIDWIWWSVGTVIFSLGGSLVAVFMKADLLDDEFLSFGEALGQYKTRLASAVLVPLFLMGLVAGFSLLIYIPDLLGSIPYFGPTVYALLYPLGYLVGLFLTLIFLAVFLSAFVFPSIIAIRKHGWFDNVVDTFEAVGTKPHILLASLFLTVAMVFVCYGISNFGMVQLKTTAGQMYTKDLVQTEERASQIRSSLIGEVDPLAPWMRRFGMGGAGGFPAAAEPNNYYHWGPGLVTGLWQTLIAAFILGYCLNLFIGGGMLTYLVVREDDYWDDEDLEDLDQLAKELEEEAKKDAAAEPVKPTVEAKPADAKPAAPAPVVDAKPVAAKPVEPMKPAEPPAKPPTA